MIDPTPHPLVWPSFLTTCVTLFVIGHAPDVLPPHPTVPSYTGIIVGAVEKTLPGDEMYTASSWPARPTPNRPEKLLPPPPMAEHACKRIKAGKVHTVRTAVRGSMQIDQVETHF